MKNKNRKLMMERIQEGWEERREKIKKRKEKHNKYTIKWKNGQIAAREYLIERLSRYPRLGPSKE